MTADDKEATLNENAGADAVSFTSAILGGGYITDEEGAAPKEKFLTAIAAVTEAISAGVISSNGPMEKSAAGTEEAFSCFSFALLSQETDPVTLLMAEEENEPKENLPIPPDFGGANKAETKDKPP